MLRRTALAATVASGALAIGGVALVIPTGASAASPDSVVDSAVAAVDPSPDGGSARPAHKRLLTDAERAQLRSTGHVSITRQTRKHGTVTVVVQRGEVMAITPTSIRLRSKDGFAHSYAITPKTKVREKGQPVDLSDLKVGERAMVVALQTTNGDVARRISCIRSAGAAAPAGTASRT